MVKLHHYNQYIVGLKSRPRYLYNKVGWFKKQRDGANELLVLELMMVAVNETKHSYAILKQLSY